MALPNNITKDHLLQAFLKIENEGIPKDADSQYYDVLWNGKRFPPKLVVSYANIFANGEELDRRLFDGGIGSPCFTLLERNGFEIKPKQVTNSEPQFWFVAQGKTYKQEEGMKFLWAPRLDKIGKPKLYWNNLLRVKKGDIIFHYSDQYIRGISIAMSDGYEDDKSNIHNEWDKKGYRVNISLTTLNPPIPIKLIKDNSQSLAQRLKPIKNKPFNRNFGVNQGYLFEFNKSASALIRQLYGKPFGNLEIDNFIDNSVSQRIVEEKTHSGYMRNIEMRQFFADCVLAGLMIDSTTCTRFVASLLTKPFVILTGLSGSGKTKLAQAFVKWICAEDKQYCLVPVGADWTNREPLLGFPNALEKNSYVAPENGVLNLLIDALKNPDIPYFLILDEMNLSHVERYFADFLSAMESTESIFLHPEPTDWSGIPDKIKFPPNLFIIGTVNIDETTYMFSPKVLDRANVIEFRVNLNEMKAFLLKNNHVDLIILEKKGSDMSESFLALKKVSDSELTDSEMIQTTLLNFFSELKKVGAEFGYRTASEILKFAAIIHKLDPEFSPNQITDAVIMQKLLPKVHGSRRKLEPVLRTLAGFCVNNPDSTEEMLTNELAENFDENVKYPLSFEKIHRMFQNLLSNGFTSFAEA